MGHLGADEGVEGVGEARPRDASDDMAAPTAVPLQHEPPARALVGDVEGRRLGVLAGVEVVAPLVHDGARPDLQAVRAGPRRRLALAPRERASGRRLAVRWPARRASPARARARVGRGSPGRVARRRRPARAPTWCRRDDERRRRATAAVSARGGVRPVRPPRRSARRHVVRRCRTRCRARRCQSMSVLMSCVLPPRVSLPPGDTERRPRRLSPPVRW